MALLRKSDGQALRAGSTLGPYVIESLIGEGGMGTVYRAVRQATGETVALKAIKDKYVGDEASERRFRHEARAASEVVHDHLVPLLDVGESQGRRYIAMRYIEGRSLQQRIENDGPLPVPEVIRLGQEIGSALGALHEVGLVHRDVKPGNILIAPDGSAHLTDFGLAKGTDFSSLTRPGTIVGTLDYLAPERIRGAPANASTDIYALGVVMFEALAGHTPFAGRSLMEVGWAILEHQPPDPCAKRSDGSRHLSSAVLLALAKEPAARPETAPLYARLVSVAARLPQRRREADP